MQETSAPAHVAILAYGPSIKDYVSLIRQFGGRRAYCDEVWAINGFGDLFNVDRIFHMDDLRIQEARAAGNEHIRNMIAWMKTHPGPIYTSRLHPDYPGLVEFPLEAVLNRGDMDNGGAPYFNNTTAYAIAFAVHIGVKRISLFGIDFTLPNAHSGERGRACCEFWLGIAAARGIEITIAPNSSLLDACAPDGERLYGYDCVDVRLSDREGGGVAVTFTEKEVIPTADEIEVRYDHRHHPNPLMKNVRFEQK